jgi:uncharacterized membrane protein (UPF0127 family)
MKRVAIFNRTRETVMGEHISVAATTVRRMVGLLGKPRLDPGAGLLIVPSQAIHTVAMNFAIDVVFLDRDWRVVSLRRAMLPFRMTGLHWKAWCVLELPSGVIGETSTAIGDQLEVRQMSAESTPSAVGTCDLNQAAARL